MRLIQSTLPTPPPFAHPLYRWLLWVLPTAGGDRMAAQVFCSVMQSSRLASAMFDTAIEMPNPNPMETMPENSSCEYLHAMVKFIGAITPDLAHTSPSCLSSTRSHHRALRHASAMANVLWKQIICYI